MSINKDVYDNRITDNALTADDGRKLIEQALNFIEQKYGWKAAGKKAIFRGLYYDSKKVGSHIVKVSRDAEKAVLKIQLRPLLFDEGNIIRRIESQNRSKLIRLPKIIDDQPWNKNLGFGYLLFEDLSDLPNIWKGAVTDNVDRELQAQFIKEFRHQVLPIEPWFDLPVSTAQEYYKKSFEHFRKIAESSKHKHVDVSQINKNKSIYFKIIDGLEFNPFHFTHAHMSGDDVKYDPEKNQFILMANLYWSFRADDYELSFPVWVDIMHIRDKNIILDDVLSRINAWNSAWEQSLKINLFSHQQYWFNLLEKGATTIILDLGAGEWLVNEIEEKSRLLEIWQELFDWIVKEKFNQIV